MFAGLYVSTLGLNGLFVTLSNWSNPVNTPVFPIWFEIQTYSGGPVKTPVPTRTWVVCCPATSQFKATRGDHSTFGSGRCPLEYWTELPRSSRNTSASALGLGNPLLVKLATSNRTPPMMVMFVRGRNSSCAYPPLYYTFVGWTGSVCPGMLL